MAQLSHMDSLDTATVSSCRSHCYMSHYLSRWMNAREKFKRCLALTSSSPKALRRQRPVASDGVCVVDNTGRTDCLSEWAIGICFWNTSVWRLHVFITALRSWQRSDSSKGQWPSSLTCTSNTLPYPLTLSLLSLERIVFSRSSSV